MLRVPGGNTIEIVDAVKDTIAHLKNLPPGLEVTRSSISRRSCARPTSGCKKEIVQALVLIALVILVFLQSMRGTIVVSVAIPLSFAITLIVLYATGQTLNVFTLGGLTLAMGRLVDNAVVVLESIHRHQQRGMSSVRRGAAGHERGRAAGARLDAHDDRGAPAGAPVRGPREEAVRAARADGRGLDGRVVLRQHVRSRRSRAATCSATHEPGRFGKRLEE